MSFFHAYLLGGLSLVAIPILVHLITRDKPKHLRFPAFRFLVERYHTNRRKLRVHHLLLLALRMLVIAALVLALARPKIFSERLNSLFNATQPVVVVLVFDTSPSMELQRGDLTRLAEARQRAEELLDSLPPESKVALLDSAEPGGEFTSRELARDRLKSLEIRAANSPVSRTLTQAFKLLADEDGSAEGAAEPPPRYLYLFSDRTRPSWDNDDVARLKPPEGVGITYVDVGLEKPTDLAIEQVTLEPSAVVPGGEVRVLAVVRATGEKVDRNITCQLDNEARVQTRTVRLEEGARQTVAFEYRAARTDRDGKPLNPGDPGLLPGPHQVVVKLEGTDRLPFNNVRHGTFVVRPGRTVLTLMDVPNEEETPWTAALPFHGFNSTVKAARDWNKVNFDDFDLVCLHQLVNPSEMWTQLDRYVSKGGKLLVIPGGSETVKDSYTDPKRGGLVMPAELVAIKDAPTASGMPWDWNLANPAPLMAPFLKLRRERDDLDFRKQVGQPQVYRYWEVKPAEGASVIATCNDGKDNPPVLLERTVGAGRVLLLTTKFDAIAEKFTSKLEGQPDKVLQERKPWTNYWDFAVTSFGFVLEDKVCRYLVGDSITADFNYVCGQSVAVPLRGDPGDKYVLRGPGQSAQGATLSVPEAKPEDKNRERFLPITRAVLPGNYLVSSVRNDRETVLEGFSLDVRSDESILVPRVPKEIIEETLGKDSVVNVDHGMSLKDAISKKSQPIELLPYLMLALLVFLAVENVLGNRSREVKSPNAAPATPQEIPRPSLKPILMVFVWLGAAAGLGAVVGTLRGSTANVLGSAVVAGLLGLSHGLLSLVDYPARERAILGGLLGSMAGVLAGLLFPIEETGAFSVLVGMTVGAGLLAADGWLLAMWPTAKQDRGQSHATER